MRLAENVVFLSSIEDIHHCFEISHKINIVKLYGANPLQGMRDPKPLPPRQYKVDKLIHCSINKNTK